MPVVIIDLMKDTISYIGFEPTYNIDINKNKKVKRKRRMKPKPKITIDKIRSNWEEILEMFYDC